MKIIKLRKSARAKHRRLGLPLNIAETRTQAQFYNNLLGLLLPSQKNITWIDDTLGGIRCLRTESKMETDRVILHLHGGAYFMAIDDMPMILPYFTGDLAQMCEAQVWSVDYRVAPEHPFPAALNDAYKAYVTLLSRGVDPQNLYILGESAGGGLTLALLMRLRDEGMPLPKAAIAISPWSDLSRTGESRWAREDIDPMLSSKGEAEAVSLIVNPEHVKDPYISPFYGVFKGLPPLMILVGGREVLYDDSARIAEKAKLAGVDVIFDVNEKMFHVYPVFSGFLKESKDAIGRIAAFVKQQAKL